MGSKGFSNCWPLRPRLLRLNGAILQAVDAFGSMSKDRIGALVVFERTTILDDCSKSGTVVDAEVSSELLKNHFSGPKLRFMTAPSSSATTGC